jgi:predicted lipid-binding transport protein (Tim44 family)
MAGSAQAAIVALAIAGTMGSPPTYTIAADQSDVRSHAEQSFDQLKQRTDQKGQGKPAGGSRGAADEHGDAYSSERYWIGKGQGDLGKGKATCQRVSELSARTDLAKQIRVMVKEHMIDRVRERSGRETEQDIELTREELVQEYLQGVRIVDRQVDEEHMVCTATAVMLKSAIPPKPAADGEPSPRVSR